MRRQLELKDFRKTSPYLDDRPDCLENYQMSSEIELLRQKRALELRKKMLLSQEKPTPVAAETPKLSSHQIVQKILTGRGSEVLEMPLVFACGGRRLRRSVEVLARGIQAFCRACPAGGSKIQLSFVTGHFREWTQRASGV